ncbi:unnamed protein product [Merluccius merluccius]
MSSSLRHPSDHFLKTREEVYVHSQISMEDSDDGLQSPSAPPYGALLGGVLPSTASGPPSPELTHSSFSHNSSYIGTPLSESGQPAERAWVGSPFAGDLMEEAGSEEDREDVSSELPVSSFLPKGQGKEREEGEACAQEAIPEYSAAEERRDSALWRSVAIGDQEHRVDMKCIEPYRRVVSHGGYYGDQNAIIVFAACFLPDSNCENYNYVMENLFLYVISTLEQMVAEDYMIVYLNGATPRRRMPGFSWMKKCYQMIDRRLKKNLKLFIIVHPSWFIRTVLGLTRPFISYKFSSKIRYVHSLAALWALVPMESVHIPASIVQLDADLQRSADSDRKRSNSAV